MGYCTRYNLSIEDGPEDEQEKFHLYMESDPIISGYNIKDFYFDEADSCKWYDHHTDMHKLSKEYPQLLFKLHGVGEEQGDEWYKYYKNGRFQICKANVTFEPLNKEFFK